MALHPGLDVLISGGRDSVARVDTFFFRVSILLLYLNNIYINKKKPFRCGILGLRIKFMYWEAIQERYLPFLQIR